MPHRRHGPQGVMPALPFPTVRVLDSPHDRRYPLGLWLKHAYNQWRSARGGDRVKRMPSPAVEQLLRELHATLALRKRPEDVAQLIQDLYVAHGTDLDPATEAALAKAAEHSMRNLWHGYTSMLEDFAKPVGAHRQLARAESLFASVAELPESAGDDPVQIEAVIRRAGEEIRRAYGQNDFGMDRLNRAERADAGLGEMSKRQYNKRFRLLRRMEAKLARLIHEQRRREVTMTGKGVLAQALPYELFAADTDTAAFIAYVTARGYCAASLPTAGSVRSTTRSPMPCSSACGRTASGPAGMPLRMCTPRTRCWAGCPTKTSRGFWSAGTVSCARSPTSWRMPGTGAPWSATP